MLSPNDVRYPLAGGTRSRHFDRTSLESRKLLENAAIPTGRVRAVLGSPMYKGIRAIPYAGNHMYILWWLLHRICVTDSERLF